MATIDWSTLIGDDRVHGSLYTDPAIFDAELERIWYRTWVYVGHESEIPEPNDYVLKSIGPQPVIMTRDRQGGIHLLLNRCTAPRQPGLRRRPGQLQRLPLPLPRLDVRQHRRAARLPVQLRLRRPGAASRELGLGRVPRIETYHGFVFGPSPRMGHAGRAPRDAAGEFDRLVRLSPWPSRADGPDGSSTRSRPTGRCCWRTRPTATTRSSSTRRSSRWPTAGSATSTARSRPRCRRDLGEGHTENDLRPEFRRFGEPLRWFGTTPDRLPDYVARMRSAYGEAAEQILIEGSPHVMIFPNLFIAEIQVFVHAAARCRRDCPARHGPAVPRARPTSTAGCCNRPSARSARPGSCSPTTPRCTSATSAACRPAARVVGDQTRAAPRASRRRRDGHLVGDATDEVPQRAIWRHYRRSWRP